MKISPLFIYNNSHNFRNNIWKAKTENPLRFSSFSDKGINNTIKAQRMFNVNFTSGLNQKRNYLCKVELDDYSLTSFKNVKEAASYFKVSPQIVNNYIRCNRDAKDNFLNVVVLRLNAFGAKLGKEGSIEYNEDILKQAVKEKLEAVEQTKKQTKLNTIETGIRICLVDPDTYEIKEIFLSINQLAKALKIKDYTGISHYIRDNRPCDTKGFIILPLSDLNVIYNENGDLEYDRVEVKEAADKKLKMVEMEAEKIKAKAQARNLAVINSNTKNVKVYTKKELAKKLHMSPGAIQYRFKLNDNNFWVIDGSNIATFNENIRDENGKIDLEKLDTYIKILKKESL